MKQIKRTVASGDMVLEYQLERKPVKNLNLRVRRDGSVYVSANSRVPLGVVDEFVLRELPFVQRTREKLAKQPQAQEPVRYVSGERFSFLGQKLRLEVVQAEPGAGEEVCLKKGADSYICMAVRDLTNTSRKGRLFDKWQRQQCLEIFGEMMAQTYPAFAAMGVAYPELRIRKMKARWGSCLTQKGVIILNTKLLEAPRVFIEYVVLHELCHFIHPNHSQAFYDLVACYMPDWQQRRAALKQV